MLLRTVCASRWSVLFSPLLIRLGRIQMWPRWLANFLSSHSLRLSDQVCSWSKSVAACNNSTVSLVSKLAVRLYTSVGPSIPTWPVGLSIRWGIEKTDVASCFATLLWRYLDFARSIVFWNRSCLSKPPLQDSWCSTKSQVGKLGHDRCRQIRLCLQQCIWP